MPLSDGFSSATTRAWPSTTNHEVPSILRVRTSDMTSLFPPGRQAQVQTSSLLRLQSDTVNCNIEPIYWVMGMFILWFPQFLLPSSIWHLAIPRCDLDQLVEYAVWSLLWRRTGSAVECRTLDRETFFCKICWMISFVKCIAPCLLLWMTHVE